MIPREVPGAWGAAVETWLSWLRASGKPRTTLKLRRTQLRRLAEAFPLTDPFAMTTDDLALWLGSHEWANETLRSHRAGVRSFYGWSHSTGRMPTNPSALLPTVKASQGLPRPAPDQTIRASRLRADPRDELMIRLAAEAGLRSCEISRVHTEHVEPDGYNRAGEPCWALRVYGKGDKIRRLPISTTLANALRLIPRGFLFPGRIDGHLSAAYVSKRLSKALEGPYTGHQLRHRFGTKAYAADRDLLAVQELLGHASPATTRRYVLVPDDAKRAAVEAAAAC